MIMQKNRIISLIIVCATIITLFAPSSVMAANATGLNTVGLENGAVYYIMNRHNGRYLSVASNSDSNGANVWTDDMNGSNAQRWRAVLNADNTYTLYAVFSAYNRVLHYQTSNSNMTIWSYVNNYSPQKFTITRISSGQYSGLYRMKTGTKYVALDTSGANVCATDSPTFTKSLWSFIPAVKGDADAFTFITPSGPFTINTTGIAATFISKSNLMGYSPYHLLNRMASDAYSNIQSDSIFVFLGHGLEDATTHVPLAAIAFSGTIGEDYGNIYARPSYTYSINSLPYNSLRNARIVFYLGCKTGVSYQGYNLVDETFAKGAHFALGTTKKLLAPCIVAWAKSFFSRAAQGRSISSSILYANYKMSLGNLYFKGDSQATLMY